MKILSLCLIVIGLMMAGCSSQAAPDEPVQSEPGATLDTTGQEVDSFEACLQAGYPVMESYPRQCRTPDGQTFVEEVTLPEEGGGVDGAAGQGQTEPGQPGAVPGSAGQIVDSFEACLQAGYPVMESYPRQCRTPDGQTFVEEVVVTAEASNGVVEPEDPNQLGLAPYPDEPLPTIPTEPISTQELLEHRSALNGQTVQVRGIIVATLLGEKACPPDRGMCAQPSLFLAETTDPGRNPLYDVRVLVSEAEQEADYPIGETVELKVMVQGDKTGLILQKVE